MIDLEILYIQSSRDHKKALQAVFDAGFAEGQKSALKKYSDEFTQNGIEDNKKIISQALGMGKIL